MIAEDILERLVGFPTRVGESNMDLLGYVSVHLAQLGIEARILPGPDDGRANLFATVGPRDVPGYVLSGHVDVVPAGEPGWQGDPFKLRRDGDKRIGRGAVDMKGFVAAVLAAAADLVHLPLVAPLHIALSYDEEAGCRGVPHLIAHLPDLCAPPIGCFVGEPTNLTPVLRHKGKATLELVASGIPGHSAQPDLGQNAIHQLVPLLAEAARLPEQLCNATRHPAFDPPYSTAQIGVISGGSAVNIIPDRASAQIEVRAIPGQSPQDALGALVSHAEALGVEARIVSGYPALSLDEDDPLSRLATDLTGKEAIPAVSFGTEAGLFQSAGIPSIVCGPGDIGRAHKPEEFITQGELDAARRLVLSLAARLT